MQQEDPENRNKRDGKPSAPQHSIDSTDLLWSEFYVFVVMACAESPEQSRPATAPCCPPEHRGSTREVSSLTVFQDKSAPEGTSNAIRSNSI